jgi:hypothetical protein
MSPANKPQNRTGATKHLSMQLSLTASNDRAEQFVREAYNVLKLPRRPACRGIESAPAIAMAGLLKQPVEICRPATLRLRKIDTRRNVQIGRNESEHNILALAQIELVLAGR